MLIFILCYLIPLVLILGSFLIITFRTLKSQDEVDITVNAKKGEFKLSKKASKE